MSRKTVQVEELLREFNRVLSLPTSRIYRDLPDGTPAWRVATSERKGLADALEHILHKADRYRGFNSVKWTQEGGYEAWLAAGEPNDNRPFITDNPDATDDYRRVYY